MDEEHPTPDVAELIDRLTALLEAGEAAEVAKLLARVIRPVKKAQWLAVKSQIVSVAGEFANLQNYTRDPLSVVRDLSHVTQALSAKLADLLIQFEAAMMSDPLPYDRLVMLDQLVAMLERKVKAKASPDGLCEDAVFISYRRDDCQNDVYLIFKALENQFGKGSIFRDYESLHLGVDFEPKIIQALRSCRLCLVMIGPNFLTMEDEHGRRRLEQEDDFVRREIFISLSEDKLVAPVLIGGASMPKSEQLPESVRKLSGKQCKRIRPGTDFKSDLSDFVGWVEACLRDGA